MASVIDWILPEPGFSSQRDNLEAVNSQIMATKPQTPKAIELRDDWARWYQSLGTYELNYDADTWDVARNKRAAFLLANAATEAEREDVRRVIETGMSSEQQAGETDRRMSGGMYDTDKSNTGLYVLGGLTALAAYLVLKK